MFVAGNQNVMRMATGLSPTSNR